jgi:hypothetical protein
MTFGRLLYVVEYCLKIEAVVQWGFGCTESNHWASTYLIKFPYWWLWDNYVGGECLNWMKYSPVFSCIPCKHTDSSTGVVSWTIAWNILYYLWNNASVLDTPAFNRNENTFIQLNVVTSTWSLVFLEIEVVIANTVFVYTVVLLPVTMFKLLICLPWQPVPLNSSKIPDTKCVLYLEWYFLPCLLQSYTMLIRLQAAQLPFPWCYLSQVLPVFSNRCMHVSCVNFCKGVSGPGEINGLMMG